MAHRHMHMQMWYWLAAGGLGQLDFWVRGKSNPGEPKHTLHSMYAGGAELNKHKTNLGMF